MLQETLALARNAGSHGVTTHNTAAASVACTAANFGLDVQHNSVIVAKNDPVDLIESLMLDAAPAAEQFSSDILESPRPPEVGKVKGLVSFMTLHSNALPTKLNY